MIATILRFLTGGVLDRAFSTIDKNIEAKTDREALKTDLLREHLRTRSDWMRAGGFWLMLAFAGPLAVWWAAVLIYSVLWCAGCAFPQNWSIAALPQPLSEWAGLIIISIFGVIGVSKLRG